jgi:hypothetical protein
VPVTRAGSRQSRRIGLRAIRQSSDNETVGRRC